MLCFRMTMVSTMLSTKLCIIQFNTKNLAFAKSDLKCHPQVVIFLRGIFSKYFPEKFKAEGVKKHVYHKIFVHFTWNFGLYWQNGISLDKKIDKCHFCHHLKVMCWHFLSFVEIDVFLLVKWACKIHRKQVTRNNSEKLIITLQYKNMFKKNPFRPLHQNI